MVHKLVDQPLGKVIVYLTNLELDIFTVQFHNTNDIESSY